MENDNNRPSLDNFHHHKFSDSVPKYIADYFFYNTPQQFAWSFH